MATMKYWQAVQLALKEELARDPSVCVLGEDVGRAGGAFGATAGLLGAFGAERVRDTPICEAGIVGVAVGAAMAGLRPVAEVMFMDFLGLAMDQLVNQAAKLRHMSAGRIGVPMVVRTICGAGRQTGPQHGQSFEAWLGHVPGLKVVWGSTPADARGLLKAAIRDADPVVVIESLSLWGQSGDVPEGDGVVPIGRAAVRRAGRDVTVVAYGSAVHRALAAARTLEGEGIEAEVLDLRTLNPLDEDGVLESLHRTRRLVVVHDAVGPCGTGAEIAALAAGKGYRDLDAPVVRVTAPFTLVPFVPALEQLYFPQAERIADAVRSVVRARRSEGRS
ncbi:MAG: alpha-ketoacid dehydrogenase subunit beta [Deltaproteobacteria bacterium]|nr:alpha-ketoacid dehydrogenase subunit beta [Deltaproteobacteria bacterium]